MKNSNINRIFSSFGFHFVKKKSVYTEWPKIGNNYFNEVIGMMAVTINNASCSVESILCILFSWLIFDWNGSTTAMSVFVCDFLLIFFWYNRNENKTQLRFDLNSPYLSAKSIISSINFLSAMLVTKSGSIFVIKCKVHFIIIIMY